MVLAMFMASLFIIKDVCAIVFYFWPELFENVLFTKYVHTSRDSMVLSIFTVLKQMWKICGILREKTFAIKVWMGSAMLMGLYSIYTLVVLAINIAPKVSEGTEESMEILVGAIIFATLITVIFIVSLLIAKKAIDIIEQQARQVFRA